MANGANYSNVINQAANTYGIPANLLTAQIQQESGFNPNAVSSEGAQGIAQFEPTTAQAIGLSNPFDPNASIMAMAKYDAQNFDRFGNVTQMLEAYNEGPNAVANGVLYPGVKSYANNIINAANGTQSTASSGSTYYTSKPGNLTVYMNTPTTTGSNGASSTASNAASGTGTSTTTASCGINDTPLLTMPVTGTPLLTPCGLWDLVVGILGLILIIAGFKSGAPEAVMKMAHV